MLSLAPICPDPIKLHLHGITPDPRILLQLTQIFPLPVPPNSLHSPGSLLALQLVALPYGG